MGICAICGDPLPKDEATIAGKFHIKCFTGKLGNHSADWVDRQRKIANICDNPKYHVTVHYMGLASYFAWRRKVGRETQIP